MVLTRRQAREDQLAMQREPRKLQVQCQSDQQNTSRHLARAGTRIEIVPSATGKGTHTRWIRQIPVPAEPTEPSDAQPEEEIMVDERFITPAPTSFPTPGAPQKTRGAPGIPTTMVSPPNWNIRAAVQSIEEEPRVDGEPTDILGSPFPGCQASWQLTQKSRPLCPEPTILWDVQAESSQVGRTDTEIIEDATLRRAFGPGGTYLYNSRGEEIFV
jgi:hypothetical protein